MTFLDVFVHKEENGFLMSTYHKSTITVDQGPRLLFDPT